MSRKATGIQTRHARSCPAEKSGKATCRCRPSYRAEAWDASAKQKVRRTFASYDEARQWRADAVGAVRKGTLRASAAVSLRAAADELLVGMEDGTVRGKSGQVFKTSTVESYRASLEQHVYEDIGAARLSSITRVELQRLVDRLVADGLSGQTVRNVLTAVAVVYRYALRRGWVMVNPTRELELPAPAGPRERIVDPEQAAKLLAALPLELRSVYALAVYGGLRRGEVAALDWSRVEFGAGRITVERSWCWRAGGFVEPKSRAGSRVVPMVAPLAAILLQWKLESGGEGLMFPSPRERARPFDPRSVARRADKAWKDSGLLGDRIILHEGRHSAASAYIASGLDPVRVSKWLGHSQVSTTTDVYAKAFAARERHDAALVDAFYAQPAEDAESVGQPAGQ